MEFLSDEWLAAMARAVQDRAPVGDDAFPDVSIVVEQVVEGGPTWSLHLDGGRVRIDLGPAPSPDIRLTCDRPTATAIASGRRAALDAFMAGDLRLGGDVDALLTHHGALAALGDVFGAVRDETTFD